MGHGPIASAGRIVSAAVALPPLAAAVKLTVVVTKTVAVAIVTDPVVFPLAIVTVDGAEAAELSNERPTVTPELGAGALRVTVAVGLLPPTTVEGLMVREIGWGPGLMVSCPVALTPFAVAVMFAVVLVLTAEVETVKTVVESPL